MSLRYKNPPITEAIIDIRVEPRPGASAVEIAAGLEGISGFSEQFPIRLEIAPASEFPVPFGGMAGYFAGGIVLGGFRYESADQHFVMQVRRDAFVFSLLPPYQSWEEFSGIVRPLWESYCRVWRPRSINRVALRYVNQLSYTSADFEQSETTSLLSRLPRPNMLSETILSGYLSQMTLPQPDIEAVSVINYSLTPVDGNLNTAVLDIDVFKSGLTWGTQNNSLVWDTLAQMRLRKNELFRACITNSIERTFGTTTMMGFLATTPPPNLIRHREEQTSSPVRISIPHKFSNTNSTSLARQTQQQKEEQEQDIKRREAFLSYFNRATEFMEDASNWDEETLPPTARALETAFELLHKTSTVLVIPKGIIYPNGEGAIRIEWRKEATATMEELYVLLYIDPTSDSKDYIYYQQGELRGQVEREIAGSQLVRRLYWLMGAEK